MAAGSWTIFQKALAKFSSGTIDLDTHSFKVVLCTSAQAMTAAFIGASTDCRYSDLTAQLTTAGGYTSGGQTLVGNSLSASGSNVDWILSSNPSWTLSSSLVFKYAIIYDDTNANKDLVCFVDADTSGGSVTATLSPLTIAMALGILRISG